MKKFLSLLLVLSMLIPLAVTSTFTSSADTPVNTVYLDDNGSDSNTGTLNSPFKTLGKCYDTLGTGGGAIVVKDTFTPTANFTAPAHTGKVTIMGYDADSKYVISGGDRRFFAGGSTEFASITIEQQRAMVFVACFNDLTFASTVNYIKNGKNSFLIGGTQSGANSPATYTPKDFTLTIDSGNWNEVAGTSRTGLGTLTEANLKDYNVTINVSSGVEIGKLATFGIGTDFNSNHLVAANSSCTVNLNGGKIRAWAAQTPTTSTEQSGYANGVTYNIGAGFDFEGSFQYEISNQDANHLVNGVFYGISGNNVRPTKNTNNPNNNKVVLDASVYDTYKDWSRFSFVSVEKKHTTPVITGNVVYLSDSGNDTNDGLTSDAPKSSLAGAYNVLGTAGGTIMVVGTFTQAAHFNAPEHTGKITIRGYDSDAHYKVGGYRYLMGGPLEFTDIKMTQTATNFMIVAFFNDLTVSSSVDFSKTGSSFIVAGGQGVDSNYQTKDYTVKSSTVTLNAGVWSEFIGTYRGSLVSPSGTHEHSEFSNYKLTVNIGGDTTIGKFMAFTNATAESSAFVAQNSLCEVNMNGGKILAWFAQSRLDVKCGYSGGVVLNIGENFDLSNSFTEQKNNQVNGVYNSIHYGFNADGVFVRDGQDFIGASKLYIADAKYAEYKDSYRFRGFATIESGESHPVITVPDGGDDTTTAPSDTTTTPSDTTTTPSDTTTTPSDTTTTPSDTEGPSGPSDPPATADVVYLSDSGLETNDGLTAQTPKKDLLDAYNLLGADGGTIVVVGTYTQGAIFNAPLHTGKITIRGNDADAEYKVGGYRFLMGGPLEFTDIKLTQTATNFMIVAFFNDLTISSTVEFSKTGSSFIVAGGQGGTGTNTRDYTVKSSTVTLNAGVWSEFIGTFRDNLNSPSGTHEHSEFSNYKLTVNIGGDTTIGKFMAFTNNRTNSVGFVAANAICEVNMNGGKILTWMAQSTLGVKCGYSHGIVLNIGENFDLSKSFQEKIDQQTADGIYDDGTNKIFYGFNGDGVFVKDGQDYIGASKLYIAEAKYEEYKDSFRFRGFATVQSGESHPDVPTDYQDPDDTQDPSDTTTTPSDTTVTPEDTTPSAPPVAEGNWVYLSDNGDDSNTGKSANQAFKTLTKSYKTLGDEGGTIIIVGEFTPTGHYAAPDHTGKVTIMGADENARYVISGATRRFQAGGPTEFANITIEQNKDMLFVARFHDFTIHSTVKHEKKSGNSFIVAGGQGGTGKSDKDYTVQSSILSLYAGYWSEVIGSVRTSLDSPSGAHPTTDFRNYDLTINVGGDVTVGKLAAFTRVSSADNFVAENSSCTINLLGGKINAWLAMSDSAKEGKHGYENGLIINIGEKFDMSGSFQNSISKQQNNTITESNGNVIFYGINGESALVADTLVKIGASVVNIAESKYEQYKDSDRFRDVNIKSSVIVDDIPESPDAPNVSDEEINDSNTNAPEKVKLTVYLSDTGSDSNDGLSADKPFKTLTKCYKTLGVDGGVIVVVGTFTPTGHFVAPDHNGKVTFRGADKNARYIISGGTRRFMAGGPTEFTDIIIEQNKDMLFVANFNNFTISSSVVHEKKAGSSFIVAGGQGGSTKSDRDYKVKSAALTLNAGTWSEVIGSLRSSLNSPSGAHSPDEFKDYTIVINVGGSAVIAKLAAFSRSFTSAAILAKNSECVINLNGGKITHWIAMSDSTAEAKNGYEDGLVVNIGPNFDLSKSFRASVDKQENNILDNVFYGINGDSPFASGKQIPINASKVYIAESKYDEYKDSDRLRGVSVLSGKYIPARNPESGDCAWMVVAVSIVAMAGAVLTIKKKKEN